MSNILQHIKQRLAQKNLRQQLNRSKVLTPILDAISEAAKLEGISGDEIIAQYLSGKNEHPVISAALGKPPTRQDAQKSMQELKRAHDAMVKKTPAKPAPKPAVAIVRPPVKATAPKNELQTYLRMPRGLAKSAYLRANAVKIQQQAKQ